MLTTTYLLGVGTAFLLIFLANRFISFRSQTPEDYASQTPVLDIREQLNGPILCEGVIYGPAGKVSSRFVADFDARWNGNSGVMDEHFSYDSGSKQDRQWRLTLNSDGTIIGEAEDLVGQATGRQSGSTVLLNYKIRLTEEAGGHVLDVTDWMYLTENGTIMNRSQFRKFGIKVAELVATMRQVPVEQVQTQTSEEAA